MHIRNLENSSTHIARWLEFLQEFTSEIQHRPGTANGNADGLSRRYDCQFEEMPSGSEAVTMDILRHITAEDNTYQPANASTGHASQSNANGTEY
jgi:hypothetical protein